MKAKRPPVSVRLKAAEYLRASTDQQKYSIENQQEAIAAYAKANGIEVVRTYLDPARTGVTMRNRHGLKRLISDVQCGHPEFTVILVYDVSRWGRFQDTDESAYYEFLCKTGGVSIRYCAEQFDNDDRLINNVIKNMKRAMASEYSRDLSSRVYRGHLKLAALGFHQGGTPGFGLRRLLVDEKGVPQRLLERSQRKAVSTDRTILVPGPKHETDIVREIFQMYVEQNLSKRRIATILNKRGIRNGRGNPWTGHTIHKHLECERYIGTLVYNRSSISLGMNRVQHPKNKWVRVPDAIEPIVSKKIFHLAQQKLNDAWPASDNDLLDYLTAALCVNGFLSAKIVDRSELMPSIHTYCAHFGSLSNAYRLIGYKPAHKYRFRGLGDFLRRLDQKLIGQIIFDVEKNGGTIDLDQDTHVLTVDNHVSVAIVIVPHLIARQPFTRGWIIYSNHIAPCNAILLVRLNAENTGVLDYHFLPRSCFSRSIFRITSRNIGHFSDRKLDALSEFYQRYRREYFGAKFTVEPGVGFWADATVAVNVKFN